MCGIAGIFNFNGRADLQLPHVVDMCNAMKHRGPDDEGYMMFCNDCDPIRLFGADTPLLVRQAHLDMQSAQEMVTSNSVVVLGHRRLSILDLSPGGHQPMRSNDNRYWIVYNGEIYNYIELRQELKDLGHHFKTESDTEVILAAYQQWGVDCQPKFNGDWAILIYDTQKHELFVSRDRFGIKPLYYYQDEERILFSSEIKGLLTHPAVTPMPNLDYLRGYLESGAKEYLKETAFANIYRFPFAHYAKIAIQSPNPQWHTQKYWEIKPNISYEIFDHEKAALFARHYYDLLSDSVRLRLRADVKVGSALSGGLDSASVVYLINQHLKSKERHELQETFSSVYKSDGTQDCDESIFIDLLSKTLNVKSNQIEPREKDVPFELGKVIWFMENPPDSTCMSGWHTFKKANEKGIIVTLDGQGADEQLAGYLSYIITYLAATPTTALLMEALMLLRTPHAKRFVIRGIIKNIIKKLSVNSYIGRVINKVKKINFSLGLNAQLAADIHTSLVTLIHYSDRVSMAHGIESRMPFMDHRLVEFLAEVPACYKIHDGWTKYIARLAFDNKLPDEICWRKDKMGWPIPQDLWFRGGLKKWLIQQVEQSTLLRTILHENSIKRDIDSGIKINILIRRLNVSLLEQLYFKN